MFVWVSFVLSFVVVMFSAEGYYEYEGFHPLPPCVDSSPEIRERVTVVIPCQKFEKVFSWIYSSHCNWSNDIITEHGATGAAASSTKTVYQCRPHHMIIALTANTYLLDFPN